MIYGMLVRQASALAFIDTFRLLGLLCLICVLLVFFFRRVKARGGPSAMH
jgi:DHA2 family multidrug resistance protein